MKLSKREIVMLAILFIIAIVFIEVRLIIAPGIVKVGKLTSEIASLEAQIDEININLASIDALTKTRDENLDKINQLSTPFLDGVESDVLLLYMHDLLQANLFSPDGYSISTVRTTVLSPKEIGMSSLTYRLSDLAEQYQQLKNPDSEQPNGEPAEPEKSVDGSVEEFSIHVTAVGSYEQVIGLVSQIQGLERTITITSLNLYFMEVDQLQIDMTVQFIGVQKLEPKEDDMAIWTRPEYDGGTEDPYGSTLEPVVTEPAPEPTETTVEP